MHVRFELLGALSASLLSTEAFKVLNLGVSGALVESGLPLGVNAEYRMQLLLDGYVSPIDVKVRRVCALEHAGARPRYHIGLEFLSVPAEAADVIAQLVGTSQAQV